MKIDIPRKVIGSLTGEVWESRGKVPRRKLPDGRTETGREIPKGHPEYEGDPKEEEGETIEIVVEESEEEELDFQPAGTIDFEPVAIEIEDAPEIPEQFETGPQAPRTTKQDADKLQDLMMGIACLFDDKTYSTEDKAIIIKLNETKTMIKPLSKNIMVSDDNVINLLNYYELINELKTIHG